MGAVKISAGFKAKKCPLCDKVKKDMFSVVDCVEVWKSKFVEFTEM